MRQTSGEGYEYNSSGADEGLMLDIKIMGLVLSHSLFNEIYNDKLIPSTLFYYISE